MTCAVVSHKLMAVVGERVEHCEQGVSVVFLVRTCNVPVLSAVLGKSG